MQSFPWPRHRRRLAQQQKCIDKICEKLRIVACLYCMSKNLLNLDNPQMPQIS